MPKTPLWNACKRSLACTMAFEQAMTGFGSCMHLGQQSRRVPESQRCLRRTAVVDQVSSMAQIYINLAAQPTKVCLV